MSVLVTGGGGFVGRNLVRALLDRGERVVVFGRREYPELKAWGARTVQGDIADSKAVSTAARDCELVFHVAAKVGAAGAYDSFYETNVVGTRNVIEACRAQGVGRLVYTSTPSVVFGHRDLEGVDESTPYPAEYDAHYPRTKAEAERAVCEAADERLRTVALRPHIVWGPGDTSLLPRLLERAPRLRKLRGPAKRMDITFIDDAVQAHLAAARALSNNPDSASGRAYFISSGEPVEIWSFVDAILGAAGRPPIAKTAPVGVAMAAGWVLETVHRLRKAQGEPRLSRWIVRELSTSHWFDISAARRDLDFTPAVDLEQGLRRLRAWVDEGGLASAPVAH